MNTTSWFSYQLTASGEGLVWAVQQVPPARREVTPPAMSEWSVARHLFHLLHYEQHRAIPYILQWLDRPAPDISQNDEDRAWVEEGSKLSIDQMLQSFQRLRAEQIFLLSHFSESDWSSERNIGIPATLRWVVTKTYQHTLDHTNSILCLSLFWDFGAASQQE